MIVKEIYVGNKGLITRSDGDVFVRFNLYVNNILLITGGWENWNGDNKDYSMDETINNDFIVKSVWQYAGETTITEDEVQVIALPTGINITEI